jgi:hypothetical protein
MLGFLRYCFTHKPAGAGFSLVCLVAYFLLSLAFLSFEMTGAADESVGWTALDCLYFAVVVVTTVGYGDLLPATDGARLFTTVYLLFALIIAGMAISQIMDQVANYLEERAHASDELFVDPEKKRQERLKDFIEKVFTFFAVLMVGTAVTALGKDWEEDWSGEDPGNRWVNGLYYTTVTLTTVGFGDFKPAQSWEKVYKIIMMIVGIPVFGSCLSAFSALVFSEERESKKLRLVKGGFNIAKFDKFNEFANELARFGGGNQGADDRISRFEFLSFVLVANGVVDMRQIRDAMRNFDDLDRDKGGFITKTDIEGYLLKTPSSIQGSGRKTAKPLSQRATTTPAFGAKPFVPGKSDGSFSGF